MGNQINGVGGVVMMDSGEAIEIVAWRITLLSKFEPGWTGALTLAADNATALPAGDVSAIFHSCRDLTFNGNLMSAPEARADAPEGWIPFLGIGPLIPDLPFLAKDRAASTCDG